MDDPIGARNIGSFAEESEEGGLDVCANKGRYRGLGIGCLIWRESGHGGVWVMRRVR